MVGWGVQTIMIEQNSRKSGKLVPYYDTDPMDSEGDKIVEDWVNSKCKWIYNKYVKMI